MKRYLFHILPVFFIIGCGKYYHFASKFGDDRKFIAQSILLDSTYKFYLRQVFKNEKKSIKIQKSNLLKQDPGDSLIEVEFLLVSPEHEHVIYVSTVPDKYQRYYANPEKYLGESYINIYDFKKISFGIYKNANEFDFFSKTGSKKTLSKFGKDQDNWIIDHANNNGKEAIIINRIKQDINHEFDALIPVAEALESPIIFDKVQNDTILFYRNDCDNHVKVKLKENRIFIRQSGNKFEIYFHVEPMPNGSEFIFFYDERIQYSPEPLLSH